MKYYLEIRAEQTKLAATKAVVDCEKILEQEGYKRISISNIAMHKYHLYDASLFFDIRKLFKIQKNDIIVIRFPLYLSDRAYKALLFSFAKLKKRGVRIILLLHDLNSIRFKEKKIFEYEKQIISISNAVIAHNEQMAKYITNTYNYPYERIVPLELFDYLYDESIDSNEEQKHEKNNRIVIAGNLKKDKAGYVYQIKNIETTCKFLLYGVNADESELADCIKYMGSYEPDILPKMIYGDYGLVWDGTSINSCEGGTGVYLKYNNPHKCSLYTACELPIIIWKEAALASYIEQNEIGFAIESINEIGKKIDNITTEEYAKMKVNIRELGKKVRNGGFLKTALSKVEKLIMDE